jgi:hydrogenase maturation protease
VKKILIAGIGNIFFGDDAFGCEAVKLLQKDSFPDSVKLVDFGIRTRDLAYEFCENYEIVILIDAVKLGNSGGTVSLIEINSDDFQTHQSFVSHEAKLEETLNFAQTLGAKFEKIYLVGCEPESLEELSETVKISIVKAVKIVKNLIK